MLEGNHRFWAVKKINSSSIVREIFAELEKIGAFNLRYDSLDDFMILGNIPSNRRRQLRKYLKNIGCTSIRIKEPDNFWYTHDESHNRQLKMEVIIVGFIVIFLVVSLGVIKIM